MTRDGCNDPPTDPRMEQCADRQAVCDTYTVESYGLGIRAKHREIEEIEIHESEGETKCLMPLQWQRVTAKSQEGTALRADLDHADTVILIK